MTEGKEFGKEGGHGDFGSGGKEGGQGDFYGVNEGICEAVLGKDFEGAFGVEGLGVCEDEFAGFGAGGGDEFAAFAFGFGFGAVVYAGGLACRVEIGGDADCVVCDAVFDGFGDVEFGLFHGGDFFHFFPH